MRYFAYGSNINRDHLTDYLDTHGVTLDAELRGQHALLHHYRLRSNYFASTHRAGACNIEPAKGECVEGVVMAITPAVRDVLRLKEGFPLRYHEIDVIVHTAATQASVRALTYVVTPEHRLDVDLPVTARYWALILAGAKHCGLSNSYQRRFAKWGLLQHSDGPFGGRVGRSRHGPHVFRGRPAKLGSVSVGSRTTGRRWASCRRFKLSWIRRS